MTTSPPIAFGAPGRYLQGPGAIARLPGLLAEFASRRPLLVADPLVRDLLCQAWPGAGALAWARLEGECTADAIDAVAAAGREVGCDLVIGAGGGKAIDAAKGARIALALPIFIVPTIAATDAPTSRVAVLYDRDHRLAEVRSMRTNPDVVLVDTSVLVRAPRRFLVSGIGDALSKRFEAEQCIGAGGVNFYGGRQPLLARAIVQACHQVLMADSEAALHALERCEPTPAFERLVEATILLSGLAFENAGLSVAHSLTRGLSSVPEVQGRLHGEEVAFGLLVQLLLDRPANQATLTQLVPFHRRIGLPVTPADLGVPATRLAAVARQVARISVETSPHIRHFSRPLAVDEVETAILATAGL